MRSASNVVGQTVTVPLHDTTAGDAVAAINRAGLTTTAISSRRRTSTTSTCG
jgi:hypothetical protein